MAVAQCVDRRAGWRGRGHVGLGRPAMGRPAMGRDCRGWELAGLPEGEEVFEPDQQAGEAGEDEGVQGRDRPGPGGVAVGLGAQAGADAGDVLGQRWRGII